MASSTIIVQFGQCLEDIALAAYGSVDGVTWLLRDNEALLPDGYSTEIEPGTELVLRDAVIDRTSRDTMRRLALTPATNTDEVSSLGDLGDYLPADYNSDHFITP